MPDESGPTPDDVTRSGGLAGSRSSRPRAAGGVTGAGAPSVPAPGEQPTPDVSTPGAPTPEPSTPVQADADAEAKVVEAAEQAARGERRWYRAAVAMGEGDDAVAAGGRFEAYPDDVRVKSGLVTPLPDTTPASVREAFDGVGQAPS